MLRLAVLLGCLAPSSYQPTSDFFSEVSAEGVAMVAMVAIDERTREG